jgi:uronate dehydrogenase
MPPDKFPMAIPSKKLPTHPSVGSGIGKILITGGKGNFANVISQELAECAEVILTDVIAASGDEKFRYHQADLTDFPCVLGVMQGIDTVVHLAVVSGKDYPTGSLLGPSELEPYHKKLLQVNPCIAYNVFESARRAGVRRIVYASSLTVYYGDKTRPSYHESDLPDPQNLYACTKLFGENLARIYHRDFGLETLSLRIGQPFPSGTSHDDVWRDNRRARSSFVTLEDIGRAVAAAVKSAETSGIFNVVSDSDNLRFELENSRRMGYVPSGRFTEQGLFHRTSEEAPWVMESPTVRELISENQ